MIHILTITCYTDKLMETTEWQHTLPFADRETALEFVDHFIANISQIEEIEEISGEEPVFIVWREKLCQVITLESSELIEAIVRTDDWLSLAVTNKHMRSMCFTFKHI